MLFTPAAHALCAARPSGAWGSRVEQLAVADHAERLAQPAVTRRRHGALEQLAVLDQVDLHVVRILDEVLDLGAADAGGDVGVGLQRVADDELVARVGRADHARAGHARLALEAVEAAAQVLDLRGRLHAGARGGLHERAVPARPHELRGLRAAQRARLGHGVLGLGRGVDAVHREPVVVVDALRAVRRGAGAELPAHLQRGCDRVVVQAHERVPEAVRARVALVARLGLGAELVGHRRALALDLRRDRGDEAVGVAGRAARVVGRGQVVHQLRQRQLGAQRVLARDRVHDPVAVGEQEAGLVGVGGGGDALDRGERVGGVVDDLGQLAGVAGAALVLDQAGAGVEVAGGLLDLAEAAVRSLAAGLASVAPPPGEQHGHADRDQHDHRPQPRQQRAAVHERAPPRPAARSSRATTGPARRSPRRGRAGRTAADPVGAPRRRRTSLRPRPDGATA